VTSWRQASAERYEILVDFGAFGSLAEGAAFQLRNASATNNRDYLHTGKIMQFQLTGPQLPRGGPGNEIPDLLVGSSAMSLTAGQATKTRRIRLEHHDTTNQFLINGKSWKDVQDSRYRLLVDGANPNVGDVEIWEVENRSGGWFHPLHIHLVDFQVLSRRGGSGRVQPWEQGPKDVVYIGEGRRSAC
jgi:FtsP/CotA-like multicopper oxidase with cupredoxin domain